MEKFCENILNITLPENILTWDYLNCYQSTIMLWIPCTFLWLFSIIDIYLIKKSKNIHKIEWNYLNLIKIILTLLLITLIIIENNFKSLNYIQLFTKIYLCASLFLTIILSYFFKIKGIVTSGILFIFWFIYFLCYIPNIFSLFYLNYTLYNKILIIIIGIVILTLLIINCFADRIKLLSNNNNTDNTTVFQSPELTSSFLCRIYFQWFDIITWYGYKNKLNINKLWNLNDKETTKSLITKYNYYANNIAKNNDKVVKQKISLLPIIVKCDGKLFLMAGLVRLITTLSLFISPKLLSLIINFLKNKEQLMWEGFFYAFLLLITTIILSLFNGYQFYLSFLTGLRIRGTLVSAIYRKSLNITNLSKNNLSIGEITNLMAIDAHRFTEMVINLHMIWSGPLAIIIAMYFLWYYLGISVLTGFFLMLLLIPINTYIAAKLKTLQFKQMKYKDHRIKLTHEIFNGIRVIKYNAWEINFIDDIQAIRKKELKILTTIAIYNSIKNFLWQIAPFFVALGSFVTFVLIDKDNVLDAETAFVSLALINILRIPMTIFPIMISNIMQLWISIERINSFLNTEEIDSDAVQREKKDQAISIEDGVFKWDAADNVILNYINLTVPHYTLTAIVGSVGAGKSSLVFAMLGEMIKTNGFVNINGSIAYVAQQAWIQNATLRDNILFGREMDKEFYNRVIEACALFVDLEMLPAGDLTEIGEKGINLSGGQKQRVALARAVYSKADIYLLDDPLSAVDSHVGKHIFDNVIGPKSILSNKTRVLVTHSLTYLPQVDNIVVMKNGVISEVGSYSLLMSEKNQFYDLIKSHHQDMHQNTDNENEEAERTTKLIKRSRSDEKESNDNIDKLIEKEEIGTGYIKLNVYKEYYKCIGGLMILCIVITNALAQLFAILSNIWLSKWSNDSQSTIPAVRDEYLIFYGCFGIGQTIALFVGCLLVAIGCLNASKIIHKRLLEHCLRLPMSFFDTTPLGRIINRFSRDVDIVDNALPMSIRTWILTLFSVFSILLVITISTPIFAFIILPIGILYFVILIFHVSTSRQLRRFESMTRSPIFSHFGETIVGQTTIRAFNEQSRFIRESDGKIDFNQKVSYANIVAGRWLTVRLETVGSFVIFFAALFAVITRDSISPSFAGLSITYALQITQMLNIFVRTTTEIESNIVAIERTEEYSKRKQEDLWVKNDKISDDWPNYGKINIKNLYMRYRDNLDYVIKDLTLTISNGEKIGIIGRTGSGKSTLVSALFRLVEAESGEIIIDDINIQNLGLHTLRSRLTIIPQDPVLFSGTLRKNIDPFDNYSDDHIWRVLELAHLKEMVRNFECTINHKISENGQNLSVGQRQLICLARALLRNTKILILDEATASIDIETDDLIQETIRKSFKHCTIITIAHRLNTILDSDKIVVLENGQIIEYDQPKILLNNHNSHFYNMLKQTYQIDNIENLYKNVAPS